MMKSSSIDLHQKVIETYENEPISHRETATRLPVAPCIVTQLLMQHRQTGELAPQPHPGRPRNLNSKQVEVIQTLVTSQSDISLVDLCEDLKAQKGVTVSTSTMCRLMKHLNLTRKKNPSSEHQGK